MKKKLLLTVSIVMTVLLCSFNVFAMEPLVVDNAGLLTEEERNALEIRLEHLSSDYNFTVCLVTESAMSGEDSETTAGDIYDNSNYGMGEGKDGLLLYISMDPREYYFLANGHGTVAFNDNGLMHMEDAVVDYLKEGKYNEAFTAYANAAEELLNYEEVEGEPYDKLPEGTILFVAIVSLLISLIIALICTAVRSRKMKTVRSQDSAANYVKAGSMNMDYSRDVFLYSTVTKTKKPEPENDHSSSSSSGGGSSRSGRGGSF